MPRASPHAPPCIWALLSSLGESEFFSILLGSQIDGKPLSKPAERNGRVSPWTAWQTQRLLHGWIALEDLRLSGDEHAGEGNLPETGLPAIIPFVR